MAASTSASVAPAKSTALRLVLIRFLGFLRDGSPPILSTEAGAVSGTASAGALAPGEAAVAGSLMTQGSCGWSLLE